MIFCTKPNAFQFIYPYPEAMGETLLVGGFRKLHEACLKQKRGEGIVLEWANDMTAMLSKHRYEFPFIVRVHDHEIYSDRIKGVNWDNIDYVWFINKEAERDFWKKIQPNVKSFVLPNAVLPEQFAPDPDPDPKEIGMLCIYPRERKRLDRALDVMRIVNEEDRSVRLTIRIDPGRGEEWKRYQELLERVEREQLNVEFDTHQHKAGEEQKEKSDVERFFRGKGWVMSTSEHEGFHYAVAEGALCGATPLVFNWEWGDPEQFWDLFVCEDIGEIAGRILAGNMHDDPRGYVVNRYSAYELGKKLRKCASC